MRYNIALLPKKVTVTYLFMESNVLHYFCITFSHLSLQQKFYFWQM